MKISKMVFAAMFAIGLGSSCAYGQTASTSTQPLPSSAQTTTATTATFTAVVAQVNMSAGTISLTQALPQKPIAADDSPTATADYLASPTLRNVATVGTIVQATVQQISGQLAVISLQTPAGYFFAMPQVAPTASSIPTLDSSLASNPMVMNPARLTPAGIQ